MTDKPNVVIFIADGMGDRPIKELGGKTPLEAAKTPYMDELARRGVCGIVDPIAPGIRAGSDTAHLAMLGYDPYETYTGRGPFEAMGVGMDVERGDVAFRLNFGTVEERGGKLVVVDRRAGRITEVEGTAELAAAVNGMRINGAEILIKESTAHRAAMIIRGEDLGDGASDIDPHEVGLPILVSTGETESDERTAIILNEFVARSYRSLKDHPINLEREKNGELPANIMLPRGIGLAPQIEDVHQLYGMSRAAVVEVGLIKGIARYVGLDVIDLPDRITGGLDSDFDALVDIALGALDKYDFVLVNAKGADVAGHDGQPHAKAEVIEKIDRAIEPLIALTEEDLYVALLADHSTPCSVGDHSGDPVPCVIAGPEVRTDGIESYGEREAAKGGLGRLQGRDILPVLLQLAGRSGKYGA
ncbi:MAG: 2,3-bisphosphoglycerate-independent phosphoglycerate mutase [bacterium]|nr:2,3-bisphosphoglycerate-independent phosphoglycerate mutase [bacterium]